MKLSSGRLETPYRELVYGTEGIGKTTYGASTDAPVFLCAEEGTDELDVVRLRTEDDGPLTTYEDALAAVRWLASNDHDRRTLVIDTVDWLHAWIEAHVCRIEKWDSIESPGYGKGHVKVVEVWRTFLAELEALQRSRRMAVLLLGHAAARRVQPPDLDPFDRYDLKVPDKVSSLLREWVKGVFFVHHEIAVSKTDPKNKTERARGYETGIRIVQTQETAAIRAKNRYGLPPTLTLGPGTFAEIDGYRRGATPEQEAERLLSAMPDEKQAKARAWWAANKNKQGALQVLRDKSA